MKRKFLILMMVPVFIGVSTVLGASINHPNSEYLFNCREYKLEWGKVAWNIDRYKITMTVTTNIDSNGDGVLDSKVAEKVLEKYVTESTWYSRTPRELPFKVEASWVGSLVVEVQGQRRAAGTWAKKGDPLLRVYVLRGDFDPPLPKGHIECQPSIIEMEPVHTFPTGSTNYDCHWYNTLIDDSPFHKGLSYKRYFAPGVYNYFVSYVKRYSNGCGIESIRVPVSLFVAPSPTGDDPWVREYYSIQPEPDNRLQRAECSQLGTYHDLGGGVLNDLSFSSPTSSTPLVDISFNTSTSSWEDREYYGISGHDLRVCERHLPSGRATSRLYSKTLDVEVNIDLFHPETGEYLNFASAECNDVKAMETKVEKDRQCIPNWTDAALIYPIGTNYSSLTTASICPKSTITLSPPLVNPYVSFFTYEYEWTPNDGLSSSSASSVTLDYENMDVAAGRYYKKYTCKVSTKFLSFPVPIQEEYHVFYIYRCPDCVNAAQMEKPMVEYFPSAAIKNQDILVQLDQKKSLIFPNPVTSDEFSLYFDYKDQNIQMAQVEVRDSFGQLLFVKPLEKTIMIHRISNFRGPKGNYILSITDGVTTIHTEKFLKL